MAILQDLDSSGRARSTEYANAADGEKDLVRAAYAADRLMRLSAHVVPREFTFDSDPRTAGDVAQGSHAEWQRKLFDEASKRRAAGDVLQVDLERFTKADYAEAVPSEFSAALKDRGFVQMELLMLREMERVGAPLTVYGTKLKNAFVAVGGDLGNEGTITAERVEMIARNDDDARWRAEKQKASIERSIKDLENEMVPLQRNVESVQKRSEQGKEEVSYISRDHAFHPARLAMKESDRVRNEKNLSFFDKVKLMAIRKLGRDEELVFKDGLASLRKQLADHTAKIEKEIAQNDTETARQVSATRQTIADLESQIATKRAEMASVRTPEPIVRGRDTLDDHYARSVSRVMTQNNSFLVHSIASTSGFNGGQVCGENSPVLGGVTLGEKVQICRAFDPSLACSTFAPGDNATLREFSGPMGVLINAGRIDFVKAGDAGTRVDSTGSRFSAGRDADVSTIELARQIESRRDGKGQDPAYDELAVSKAQIAGVYLNVDRLVRGDKGGPGEKAESGEGILSVASKIFLPVSKLEGPELPMYIILRGHMHQVTLKDRFFAEAQDYDVEARKKKGMHLSGDLDEALGKIFNVGPRVTPADLAQRTDAQLSAAEKVRIGAPLVEKFQPEQRDGMISKLRSFALEASNADKTLREKKGLPEIADKINNTAGRFLSMMGGLPANRAPDQSSKNAALGV